MNPQQLSDEELHQLLTLLKKEFEASVAAHSPSETTSHLYQRFVAVRDEANRRLTEKNSNEPAPE